MTLNLFKIVAHKCIINLLQLELILSIFSVSLFKNFSAVGVDGSFLIAVLLLSESATLLYFLFFIEGKGDEGNSSSYSTFKFWFKKEF